MSKESKDPVLEIQGLSKSYGTSRGIIDVNLAVERGEVFGFIGPNGAGKSTTIRTVMGLLFPDAGRVNLFGEDSKKKGPELRKRIGFVPSELNYYAGLKTGRLLEYSAALYGVKDRTAAYGYAERLQLDLNRPITDLSLGNRKKVAIIQALIHRPDLLILDEPTSGLDPLIQSRFYEILREEQERGATLFFSSHTLSEVERLCSRVAIIREGKIVEVRSLEELKHLSLKRFRLLFEKGKIPTSEDLRRILPRAEEITLTPRGAEGLFGGDVRELMTVLSTLPLKDAVLEDPGLEEIFMHYYNAKEES